MISGTLTILPLRLSKGFASVFIRRCHIHYIDTIVSHSLMCIGIPCRYSGHCTFSASNLPLIVFSLVNGLTIGGQISYRFENQHRDRVHGKPVYDAKVDTSELADKVRLFLDT